jgi:hypothetical protein
MSGKVWGQFLLRVIRITGIAFIGECQFLIRSPCYLIKLTSSYLDFAYMICSPGKMLYVRERITTNPDNKSAKGNGAD